VTGRTSDEESSKPGRPEPTTAEPIPCSGGALHRNGPWSDSRSATPDPATWQGLIFRIVDDPTRTLCALALTCPPLTTAALLVNSTVGLTVWTSVGGGTILLLARIIVVCSRRATAAQAGGIPGASQARSPGIQSTSPSTRSAGSQHPKVLSRTIVRTPSPTLGTGDTNLR
jgi:hypothetical protein